MVSVGDVHDIGSTPDAVEMLMESLGRGPVPPDIGTPTPTTSPWLGVLDAETSQPRFADLMAYVEGERARHDGEVYPAAAEVFAAFDLTPYEQVKVVILGQDPYPNPGDAMGLSFSVPRERRMPTSLVNMHAAMRAEGITPPLTGDLTGWAKQGVLLLNTALTVPRGDAGGHLVAWRPFSDAVIRLLSAREQPVVFVLWGAKAQRAAKRGLIDTDRHRVITAPHPAARREHQARFRAARTFSQVDALLHELGSTPIDWAHP